MEKIHAERIARVRAALQSCGLRFVHPDTGKPMAFSLPLPAAAPWKEFLE